MVHITGNTILNIYNIYIYIYIIKDDDDDDNNNDDESIQEIL